MAAGLWGRETAPQSGKAVLATYQPLTPESPVLGFGGDRTLPLEHVGSGSAPAAVLSPDGDNLFLRLVIC